MPITLGDNKEIEQFWNARKHAAMLNDHNMRTYVRFPLLHCLVSSLAL